MIGPFPWPEVLMLAGIGSLAGFCSGLLGIGGGLVVVPGLLLLLEHHGYPLEVLPLLSAGTSLALMVFTAAGSTWMHLQLGNIRFDELRKLLPWVLIAELAGTVLAHTIHARLLEQLLGLLLLVLAVDLLRRAAGAREELATGESHDHPLLMDLGVGGLIGAKSGLFGLGGGAFAIPYFNWIGLPAQEVVGTTALLTWPVALLGSFAYLLMPLPGDDVFQGVTGSVQWYGVLAMAPATLLMAPLGARLCASLPQQHLKRLFGVLLLAIGVKILFWPVAG